MKKKRCMVVKMSNEARVLKEFRNEKDLSMVAVGSLIGKSDSYISQVENGRADIPTDAILFSILKVYDISFSEYQSRVNNYKASKVEVLESLLKKLNDFQIEKLITTTEMLLAS